MADSPKVLITLLSTAVAEYIQTERQRLQTEKLFLQSIASADLSPTDIAVDKFSSLFLVDEVSQFFGD